MNIIKANAEYTDGGIYRYTAQTDEGTWLLGDSEWDELYEMDADPDETEGSWYSDWCEAHEIMTYRNEDYIELLKGIISWICENEPSGNYQLGELVRYLDREVRNYKEGSR